MIKSIFLLFIVFPSGALAFPEMLRHGYVNCSACHVSPAGGGVLTPYGRELSVDLLSRWGSAKEAQPFQGVLPASQLQDWLLVGGDYRGLQYHYENDQVKDGRWIQMQGLIDAAVKIKNWTLNLGFGYFDRDSRWTVEGKHYSLMAQFGDFLSVRVGKIIPQFGLNIPEHISPTRGSLGFGAYDERSTAEVQWANENWTVATGYSEAPRIHSNPQEKAVSVKVEKVFRDTWKPGVSLWRGESPTELRQLVGLHGMIGFTKKLFWLSEWDWSEVYKKVNKEVQHSAATYQKFGYEFQKGLVGLLVADGQLGKLEDPQSQILHYGLGLQFFPRPHFELEGIWTKEKVPSVTSKEGDYAWFLFHYYL